MITDINKNRLKSCKSNPSFGTTYEEAIVVARGEVAIEKEPLQHLTHFIKVVCETRFVKEAG